jgi:cation transport regulator ChaC
LASDTQSLNKQRHNLDQFDEIWLFGYGSLIYKVDFPYLTSEYGHINGYVRRFWQGSHDHRGTPENPGRVLTLIPAPGTRCFGRAFKVEKRVFDHLDHREKNGYLREILSIELADGRTVNGLVYIAGTDNAAFLGEASVQTIAKQISQSEGPSGKNQDYVFQLADALRQHQEHDEHVFAVEQAILALNHQL